MLRIHGSARSRAIRTLWMVGELGLDYEHDDLLPRSPGTRTPEFLALNPNGRVPVIEDDGFVLSESMAINLYLAKKHGKLYPSGARNEALAWQWSLWETDRLDRQVVTYANHSAVLPEAQRDPALAKAAWDEMVPALDVLEGALKQVALAGRRRLHRRRPERCRGALSRPVPRSGTLAHGDRMAATLLGPARRQTRPRHARVAVRPTARSRPPVRKSGAWDQSPAGLRAGNDPSLRVIRAAALGVGSTRSRGWLAGQVPVARSTRAHQVVVLGLLGVP